MLPARSRCGYYHSRRNILWYVRPLRNLIVSTPCYTTQYRSLYTLYVFQKPHDAISYRHAPTPPGLSHQLTSHFVGVGLDPTNYSSLSSARGRARRTAQTAKGREALPESVEPESGHWLCHLYWEVQSQLEAMPSISDSPAWIHGRNEFVYLHVHGKLVATVWSES